ncbi:transcriptional regulator [Clostridium carboxidivorans P7]|uniref:Stage 0 sporulation protein A homolog n=1 Tax=Clostridium carboxidivorans P7 TaxID=536227 RepID=C6PRC4_9CLOT|nr:response regulator transcription factor [Clostridium carboxidivorans]AKN31709.1 transcriptional regulator [Clostridium carboxidivorans P7]EET88224.1 two component transcriptional regulator, winged helix family [Clostridium carboxidivorans P7]EFG87468.1 response regulator receiver domain protein [Clostridium carboxidivorans P7]
MNKTILIVDDEERMRFLIDAYLKKEGFNVLQAENGKDALKIFKENTVELVVLDIMMPVMDGWTTCKEIRKISQVPVIMLTAKAEDEDQILGFELGTDNYVTKPFSPKLLVAKVKALLKRAYPDENNQDNFFDGLYINEKAHETKINDEDIYLSPKEFELLSYFAKNKGMVLSREQILDSVWGIDYYGDLRTVDTHIKRLREKLGEKAYLISTVRGTGYKFEMKGHA